MSLPRTTVQCVFSARLRFKAFHEPLVCDLVAPGIVELREFSRFVALGPGDQVTIDAEGIVTGVHRLAGTFLVEVFFDLASTEVQRHQLCAQWAETTDVMDDGTFQALLTSDSYSWLRRHVEPEVWVIEVLRAPGQPFDLHAAIRTENEAM